MCSTRIRTNERGATIVMVAVSLVAILSMLALAIDLGMLFKARSDAQRAADAAALAGAKEFLDFLNPADALGPADHQARLFADTNRVMGTRIDTTTEVTVNVIEGERKVRVRVARAAVGTWFASLFGQSSVAIAAKAAAQVAPASKAKCVKPAAVRDLWNDSNQDLNGNRIWDWQSPQNERWQYDPGEAYGAGTTGYGSGFRNGGGSSLPYDYGRQVVLVDLPSRGVSMAAGWGADAAANDPARISQRIRACDPDVISVDQHVTLTDQGSLQQTGSAWDQLAAQDPGLQWDDVHNTVQGASTAGSDWHSSPRVITVSLFDPRQLSDPAAPAGTTFAINNFARLFLEQRPCADETCPVTARFLGFVLGMPGEPGEPTGTLVRTLRLVE
jgi:hypothetical protein